MLTGKEDDKVSLLAGDMTIYISDPKSFTRKPLQWDVKLIHKKSMPTNMHMANGLRG